ncbi:hypothetical protein O4H49_01215 [Kiloniella laminariae]|uniref:Transposase DDE domain-containing protein n=1 Tax=Kiloniella laminariae TaxID=454162 RepID=A0ABT4LEM6_9PROT|nr:hypothetical protein [Kiloniella laminariae]MCZ4279375.1 hypothetical protein [Kiloniella laminariae]
MSTMQAQSRKLAILSFLTLDGVILAPASQHDGTLIKALFSYIGHYKKGVSMGAYKRP